jgi:hypothetical protein
LVILYNYWLLFITASLFALNVAYILPLLEKSLVLKMKLNMQKKINQPLVKKGQLFLKTG